MTAEKGLKDLRRALGSGAPVAVYRGIDDVARLKSYVVGVGRKWALLHTVSDEITLNGHSAVRLRDVEHATGSGWLGARFAHRALKLRGEHARPLAQIDLDSTRNLVETMATAFPLISVYLERLDPDACFIGRVNRVTRKGYLRLQEIDSKAAWDVTCSRTKLADITRVDVGGGYIDALHLVGGPPPGH
ncbi:hypothetical protein AB0395_26565 [Streptosporangium sp. NPDC051023]|uniref:hypothetical protein n=1 Tax=Streptosporangium sp. NPDC051023 TaxID=3155410 RepID=UPI00344B60DB